MKITLVHTVDQFFADTQMFGMHSMPVWAYTLAAHLALLPDVETTLFDDRFDQLADIPPADLFLFTGINQDYDAIVATHRALRQRFPQARFVIGGPICWSFETGGRIRDLEMFDHVVVGDGEDAVQRLVCDLRTGATLPRLIRVPERFDLGRALPLHRGLLEATLPRYYGAVLEVSRGCPFLCEFCDIRVLPDNNRAHVKKPALIVEELDALYDLGARQALLACDNFIGDHRWAEAVCDELIDWHQRTGKRVSLYTWLTVNLAKHPSLLRKLRLAGFDMFFIGVESFSQSSLLETAKVQNQADQLVGALRTIQSYGFIVVAGLIFGFDSDPEDAANVMLRGLVDSGLISGDPSLLTAPPGTPLYKRMALSNRLRDGKLGLGGFKYKTNIKYLRPAEKIRSDFRVFVEEFNRGRYQYRRLMSYYRCLESPNYLAPQTAGYADVGRMLSLTLRHRKFTGLLCRRILVLLRSPERLFYLMRALTRTFRMTSPDKPLWFVLKFWLIVWSNSLMKYASVSDAEFDIESVAADFAVEDVLPAAYETSRQEDIPETKIRAQRRVTAAALREFVQSETGELYAGRGAVRSG